MSRLANLFFRLRGHPVTANGERVYAIGDVHGRLDLFRILIRQIEADVSTRGRRSTRIVLLGDLIDRGSHSHELLVLAKRLHLRNSGRIVVLRGNHEEMLLASADGNASAQRLWVENGGDATLRSYGLDAAEFMRLTPEKRGRVLWRAVGADMLAWLESRPLVFRSGNYFFCHAGIRPGVPLENQRREDLLWIRREFVTSDQSHGAVIVHGHSATDAVEVSHNRINVDTAAYRSGQLTAVGLEGPYRWFLSTTERYLNRAALDEARYTRRPAQQDDIAPAEPSKLGFGQHSDTSKCGRQRTFGAQAFATCRSSPSEEP